MPSDAVRYLSATFSNVPAKNPGSLKSSEKTCGRFAALT